MNDTVIDRAAHACHPTESGGELVRMELLLSPRAAAVLERVQEHSGGRMTAGEFVDAALCNQVIRIRNAQRTDETPEDEQIFPSHEWTRGFLADPGAPHA